MNVNENHSEKYLAVFLELFLISSKKNDFSPDKMMFQNFQASGQKKEKTLFLCASDIFDFINT